MARIHAHRKGRSSSARPLRTASPTWVPLGSKEIEQQISQLAREGKSTPLIGAFLRDQFGVPDVKLATGKTVRQILREQKLEPRLPEEITNLLRRVVNLQDHIATNPKDLSNQRALTLVESKIRRLAKYFIREGRLPTEWTYSRDTVKLLLE